MSAGMSVRALAYGLHVAPRSAPADPVLAVLSFACGLSTEIEDPGHTGGIARAGSSPATVMNDAALAVLSEACQTGPRPAAAIRPFERLRGESTRRPRALSAVPAS